jgi:hypothetical protein
MGNPRSKWGAWIVTVIGATAATIAIAACGDDDGDSNGGDEAATDASAAARDLPQGSEPVNLDPADFTTEIDNPYWPMAPGSRWVYRETDEEGAVLRVVVTVTDRTKLIANGVEARVVRDVVSEDGEPVEITDDWYAQDSAGNIWYLGEDTAEYKDGKVVTREGSFEAGVDGALPGIIMPADPAPGLAYRQEYYEGEAEDRASVLGLDAQATVPFGSFDRVLETEDVNPLSEPPTVEHKYFARDVGPVLAVGISGGGGREELVSYSR